MEDSRLNQNLILAFKIMKRFAVILIAAPASFECAKSGFCCLQPCSESPTYDIF
jgi:hypothetical protein